VNSCDIVPRVTSSVATSTDPPVDPGWHDTSVLVAELATLNQRIARYITQMLDADAGRRPAVDAVEQAALGWQLIELGQLLRDRAEVADVVNKDITQQARLPKASAIFLQPRSPAGERFRQRRRREVISMNEIDDNLVVGVTSTPVVQDRTEIQLSDGMDDGETRDPA
jgi:hypothetical protein